MKTIRYVPLMLLAAFATAACAGTGDPGVVTEPARAQQDLSERALATLDRRVCEALQDGPRLEAMPPDELACLGSGVQVPADTGDGRPTVVNLWASWCAPCVREMPALQAAFARTSGAVRFVGIDTEDELASAAGLLDFTGVTYEQRNDPDARVRAALRAPGLPVTVVYDARGREVARRLGEIQPGWLEQALVDAGVPPAAPTAGRG